jgi:hypothetical protein
MILVSWQALERFVLFWEKCIDHRKLRGAFFLERLRPIHSTVWIPSQHTAAMQYACHQPGGAVRFKW